MPPYSFPFPRLCFVCVWLFFVSSRGKGMQVDCLAFFVFFSSFLQGYRLEMGSNIFNTCKQTQLPPLFWINVGQFFCMERLVSVLYYNKKISNYLANVWLQFNLFNVFFMKTCFMYQGSCFQARMLPCPVLAASVMWEPFAKKKSKVGH